MFGKTRRQLARIEAALEEIRAAVAGHGDALSLATPGGLAVVAAEAKQARTAAESAFVGMQTLASQATVKPGLPEVVEAVSAHTDALRAMEATVRTATGPQPAVDAAALDKVVAKAAAKGMGARLPKTGGGKP
jgi:hypothetical protein